jgi:hypothetical protein
MTIPSEDVATPSERLLRRSFQQEGEVAESYAAAQSTLRAYVAANAFANSSINAIALSGSGMQSSIHAQLFDVDDPRCVVFSAAPIVSASALSTELRLLPGTATVRITGDLCKVGRKTQAFSLCYGEQDEHEVQVHFEPMVLAEMAGPGAVLFDVECVSVDPEALAAMDEASAEYRSRRTKARAEERRLRRHDRE